jgi:hypothetical protein
MLIPCYDFQATTEAKAEVGDRIQSAEDAHTKKLLFDARSVGNSYDRETSSMNCKLSIVSAAMFALATQMAQAEPMIDPKTPRSGKTYGPPKSDLHPRAASQQLNVAQACPK